MNRLTYQILRFNHALKQWVLTQFTLSGLGILCAAFMCGLISVDIKRSVSYQIFALALGLIAAAALMLPFARRRVEMTRVLPRFGTVGVPMTYQIHIRNPNRKRLLGLKLFEQFAHTFPTFEEFKTVFSKEREFQRKAWFSLLARKQWAFAPAQSLPPLKAEESMQVSGQVVPLRRGVLQFHRAVIACPEPMGLANRRLKLSLSQSVLILPKRYPLPDIRLPGTKSDRTHGEAVSIQKGTSEEFRALREYRPGDPMRKIHWKSWAKTGRPIIREDQDSHEMHHALILDTFVDADYSEVLEEAVAIASSFAYTIQSNQSRLNLVFTGSQVHSFTDGSCLHRTERILETLAGVQPDRDRPFNSLVSAAQYHMASMRGCLCIFLDWDKERQALVEQLQTARIDTLALVIEDERGLSQALDRSCLRTRNSRIEVLNVHNIPERLLQL